jgi:hypothetical protein
MNAVLDEVKNHLEFLGYQVEEKTDTDGIYGASHDTHWNFLFSEKLDGIFFRSFVTPKESADEDELLEFVNDLHTKAVVARFYIDSDGDLAIESWWPNIYEKNAFVNFVNAWHHDIGAIAQHPRVKRYFD